MELFCENSKRLLAVNFSQKSFIVDIRLGSKYVFVLSDAYLRPYQVFMVER